MNKNKEVVFKLTFSGNVKEFEKLSQVKLYLRHHRAVSQDSYTLHKMVGGVWVLWDVYLNKRV